MTMVQGLCFGLIGLGLLCGVAGFGLSEEVVDLKLVHRPERALMVAAPLLVLGLVLAAVGSHVDHAGLVGFGAGGALAAITMFCAIGTALLVGRGGR